jgi:hypothetical protein
MPQFQVFFVIGDAEPVEATGLYEQQLQQAADTIKRLRLENAELRQAVNPRFGAQLPNFCR